MHISYDIISYWNARCAKMAGTAPLLRPAPRHMFRRDRRRQHRDGREQQRRQRQGGRRRQHRPDAVTAYRPLQQRSRGRHLRPVESRITRSHAHSIRLGGPRGKAYRGAMILVIDNYDSFTYNLVHYLNELGAETLVHRNDAISVDEALGLRPEAILLSPGPCTPNEAGICLGLVGRRRTPCRSSASAWAIRRSARRSAARSSARAP